MPTFFTATTSQRLNIEQRAKAGAQRVDKIEEFIQNCVEGNSALTGFLLYRRSDNPLWRGFGTVLSQCPNSPRRYAQQIYHFLHASSHDTESPLSSQDTPPSSQNTVDSLPDEPKNKISDVLEILTTDIITVGLCIDDARNLKKLHLERTSAEDPDITDSDITSRTLALNNSKFQGKFKLSNIPLLGSVAFQVLSDSPNKDFAAPDGDKNHFNEQWTSANNRCDDMIQSGFATHVLLALCKPGTGEKGNTLSWYVYSKERNNSQWSVNDNVASNTLVSLIALDYLKGLEMTPGLKPTMQRLASVRNSLNMPSSWKETPNQYTIGNPFVHGRSEVMITPQTYSVPQVHSEKRTFTEILVNLLNTLVGYVLNLPDFVTSAMQWRQNVRNGTFQQKNMPAPPKKNKR